MPIKESFRVKRGADEIMYGSKEEIYLNHDKSGLVWWHKIGCGFPTYEEALAAIEKLWLDSRSPWVPFVQIETLIYFVPEEKPVVKP